MYKLALVKRPNTISILVVGLNDGVIDRRSYLKHTFAIIAYVRKDTKIVLPCHYDEDFLSKLQATIQLYDSWEELCEELDILRVLEPRLLDDADLKDTIWRINTTLKEEGYV